MNRLIGAFLFLHALGHMAGFAELTGLRHEGVLVTPTIFDGRVLVAPTVAKFLGFIWLVLGLSFGLAGLAVLMEAPWTRFTVGLAVLSLIMSTVCWPASKLGVPINLLLLVVLLARQHADGLRDFN